LMRLVDAAILSKVLKEAMKTGKTSIGAKESIGTMKGTKAVLCTRSVPPTLGSRLREEAKKHGVPVVDIPQSSSELARLIGRPYRVSALALRSVSDADVKQLTR
jgi:large subunit ribosomal protein L30e